MVVGIGIGTNMAINGAIAHAFNDVIFKGLLFMSVGAVMYRTGKINATDLGGLYRSMPITCGFCIVGAASISAFPLFSAFISKSMVMSAAADQGLWVTWFTLLFAAAGVFHHAGIKIPFFTFFGHDSGLRVKEAPKNMLIAMGIAAFLCIFIGSFPSFLYSILPYEVHYQPYTYGHVLGQLQLLFFSAMAFTLLLLAGIYPAEKRALNIDSDWFYRKGFSVLYMMLDKGLNGLNNWTNRNIAIGLTGKLSLFFKDGPARLCMIILKPLWELSGAPIEGPQGCEARLLKKFRVSFFSVGSTAVLTLVVLLFFLLFF
jgi:multicomponent Na+:H+ antiporter subunit D